MASSVQSTRVEQLSQVNGYAARGQEKLGRSTTLAQGEFYMTRTLSDILVHSSDLEELQTTSTSCERAAELVVGVLFEGKIQFALNEREYTLEVEENGQPICFLLNALHPLTWRRQLTAGNRVNKVVCCAHHNALAPRFQRNVALDLFVQSILAQPAVVMQCVVDLPLRRLAARVQHLAKEQTSDIELEGTTLTLLAECFAAFQKQELQDMELPEGWGKAKSESLKICRYIEQQVSNTAVPTDINLKHIAKHLGISVSTAQRQFKHDFKMTIMDFVRQRRLALARNRLQHNMSIGEAAYLAGYTHSSNFCLAFKKTFGISPGVFTKSKEH